MTTGIGEALRAARRQQGRSLADAAATTRVRESYLAALEEEEFGALGGDVYVKGFLRSYARYLGLDPEPLLEAYRREHERGEDGHQVSLPSGVPLTSDGRRDGLPPAAAAGAVALVLLALFLLLSRGGGEEPAAPAPAPVEGTSPPVVEPTTPPPIETAPTPTATDGLDPNAPAEPAEERTQTVQVPGERLRVRIVVDEPGSRVRVVSDGVTRGERDLPPGTDLIYEAAQTIEFRVTNAAAVRLVANGEPQGELGGPDEVVIVRFVLAS